MKRWLFNLAAGASLLVAILVCILWLRSQWEVDALRYHVTVPATHRLELYATTDRGGVTVGRKIFFWPPEAANAAMALVNRTRRPYTWRWDAQPTTLKWSWGDQLWFTWWSAIDTRMVPGATSKEARLRIPYWAFLLSSMLIPTVWCLRRRRIIPSGICIKCGYDLRATPERCPECGTVPETAKGAAV